MTGGVTVVSVSPVSTDEPAVVELLDELTAELAAQGYTAEQTFGYTVEQIERSGLLLFGARTERGLVGVGGIDLQSEGFAELRRFYVRSSARGTGVADAILDAVLTYAAERGIRRLRLETGDRQRAAISFYRRRGFLPIERFPPYQDSATSVCLERAVDRPTAGGLP